MLIQVNSIAKTLNALDLIAERQKVLSSNLANMDTPNYRRKDLSFSQYLAGTGSSLETALAAKMGPSPVNVETSTDTRVNPATELTEMQKNSLLYTVAARRMTSAITQMRSVLNLGNG